MNISASLYRKIQELDPALRDVLLSLLEEIERSREGPVTRIEFLDLREITKELAEAQKRTEVRVEELAEAQKRTEVRVGELTEAQKRTEFRLEELAEAQKRTEVKVEELAEAQKRTELRVEALVEAQRKTERELQLLAREHKRTREQVGGLSATVGYRLEDEAFKALPVLLARDHGLRVEGRLKREFVEDRHGRKLEVNIFGNASKNGTRVVILGEAKSQLSKKAVNEFMKKKLERFSGVFEHLFPVIVTYMISEPDVEDYVKSKGIALYYSYDF